MRSERAFTLIELLVVMIIIAVLMAVAVPAYLSQKSGAQKSKITKNLKLISEAIETCSLQDPQQSYTGCDDHRRIWQTDRGLKPLMQGGVECDHRAVSDCYDVDPILNDGSIPASSDESVSGYVITASVFDGDQRIYFALAHWPDGTVTKMCGAGHGDTATQRLRAGGPRYDPRVHRVAGSRICTTGTWG